jgi:hypothetical protein
MELEFPEPTLFYRSPKSVGYVCDISVSGHSTLLFIHTHSNQIAIAAEKMSCAHLLNGKTQGLEYWSILKNLCPYYVFVYLLKE